jgi:hypothetical protein
MTLGLDLNADLGFEFLSVPDLVSVCVTGLRKFSGSSKIRSKDMTKGVALAIATLALLGPQLEPTNGAQPDTFSVESLRQFHDLDYTLPSYHNVEAASRNNSSVRQSDGLP